MEETTELLFFDTFSHESSEEINLDLVQFPKPVFIGEIRIIPLGARVQADFPGGVRLGATNPSQFKIEFFVNDLGKPGASAFEHLGAIDYNQNGNIHFEYSNTRHIPTDGLVLRGWYTTITLAVYGYLRKSIQPQPAIQDVVTVDWLQQHGQLEEGGRGYMVEGGHHYTSYPQEDVGDGFGCRQSPYWHQEVQEPFDSTKESYEGENWEIRQDEKHWESGRKERHQDFRYDRRHPEESSPEYRERGTPEYDGRQNEFYGNKRWSRSDWQGSRKRPHTPPPPPTNVQESPQGPFESMSPGDVESISEGDIPETEAIEETKTTSPTPQTDTSSPQHQLEPILSDDEILDDQFQDMEYDFSEFTEDPLLSFNPYKNEIPCLKNFEDPALSFYEWEIVKNPKFETTGDGEILKKLLISIPEPQNKQEAWVEAIEQVVLILPKSLALIATSEKDIVLEKLMDWVSFGLDFQKAVEQPQPGFKIRHLKAGIRLVDAFGQLGESLSKFVMKKVNAHLKLLELHKEEYMALIIKLQIIKALDSLLSYQSCIQIFLDSDGYSKLFDLVEEKQHARVKHALTSLVRKLHLHESLSVFNSKVKKIQKEEDFELASLIDNILQSYEACSHYFSQPRRFLPVTAQFEIKLQSNNFIYNFFRSSNTLDNFLKLLSHPGTLNYFPIVAPINGILSEMIESNNGMKFLASSEINGIIRCLLGSKHDGESINPGVNPTLGLHLAYRLQALCYLDALKILEDPDTTDVLENLQGLFNLTLSNIGNIGKSSVVHVLSQDDNLDILLKLLKPKINRRSPSRGYICDMVQLTVKLTNHVPFLRKYAQVLIEMSKKDFNELSDLQAWLNPVLNCSNLSQVCEILKNSLDTCATLPPELIIAMKLLKNFGVPKHERDLYNNSLLYKELRYKYVILELYSSDGISTLTSILHKICQHYEQPFLHSSRFLARQGLNLLAVVLPAVQLIRRMITYVINVYENFKDLTAISVLLETYGLMQAIPLNAQAHTDAMKTSREIVETLLAYTQPMSNKNEADALNKSLWTRMISEVVKFSTELPFNFVSGLSVLSELLPLPFPIQTKKELSEDDASKFVNSRLLWSAHLHSLDSDFENLITSMSISNHQPLVEILRRVCIQLSDLAAPSALMVVRAILENLCNWIKDSKYLELSKMLNFLASLMTQGVIKSSFINLITEKYAITFQSLLTLLKNQSNQHRLQESIASLLQPLCDSEISFLPPPDSSSMDIFMANSLPPKDTLQSIITTFLEHLMATDCFNTAIIILRTFILLSEHEYGFYHLKTALEKQEKAIFCLLTKIKENFSKGPSLVALSTLLELFSCVTSESDYPLRTSFYTFSDLIGVVKWTKEDHPLVSIEELLKKNLQDDDTLENLLENVSSLNKKFSETEETKIKEIAEPILPQPDTLLAQFAMRNIYVVVDGDDDRLSAVYWLSSPNNDETEDPDVQLDLAEVAKNDLNGLILGDAVVQLFDRKSANRDVEPLIKKAKVNDPLAKKTIITPLRIRSLRGSCGARSSDMFRSRPPNTSRPPSLHVDDFVALETCGSATYSKIQEKLPTRSRGRGRAFGAERGRYLGGHVLYGTEWERSSRQYYNGEMVDSLGQVRFGRNPRPGNSLGVWGPGKDRSHRAQTNRHVRYFQTLDPSIEQFH